MPDSVKLNDIIARQIHPLYSIKYYIWIQIAKSYAGGIVYKYANPSYLHKFSLRESEKSFNERKKRAVFFNNTQPLADTLTGFIFSGEPIRKNITLEYLLENANLFQNFNSFMKSVATNSIMYTTGILVDSPKFKPEEVRTEADRQVQGLNPYCIQYMPWKIRNFYFDKRGRLQWIILDNSEYDNSNPFAPPRVNISYRLWTPQYYQDFTAIIDNSQNSLFPTLGSPDTGFNTSIEYGIPVNTTNLKLEAGEEISHPCGRVPFIFVNWNDKNSTHIVDTIFEDIALFDQAVFNYMSLMDEMLSGGVFKYLFWPGTAPKIDDGFSNLALMEFSPETSSPPFFAGPSLGDVEPFINAINFYLIGIKRSLGLDTDQEKSYAQSGEAKKFDFTKVKALLTAGAIAMEEIEENIFALAGLWEGKTEQIESEYKKDFLGEEQSEEIARMMALMTLPYSTVRRRAAHRIVDLNFNDLLNEVDIKEMYDDIDTTEKKQNETKTPNPKLLAALEKQNRQGTQTGTGPENNLKGEDNNV